jgi:hypothetical protein
MLKKAIHPFIQLAQTRLSAYLPAVCYKIVFLLCLMTLLSPEVEAQKLNIPFKRISVEQA